MARRRETPAFAPLLVWTELHAVGELRDRREELRRSIALLPVHSHRRVELEARLRALTSELIVAERRLATEVRR